MSATQSDAILARMMALHPKVIDLTLDRVWRLLERVGNPHLSLPPVIHIAGTNGKGSTLAMIRAGLEAAGHVVHAYTSPHLARFHERIRLAGNLISEPDLTALLDECYDANGGEDITYFEITTVAALLAFARTPADYTLLEVGLGGRLDATNVIDRPRLAVITPVSMDHESFLGDTVAKIAAEKAGIIKRRVPCVVGPQSNAALEVIEERAARLGAPVLAYAQQWHAAPERDGMVYQDDHGLLDLPRPALPGDHQIQNAGIAIAALRHLGCDAPACEAAVTNVVWPARLQRLRHGPLVDLAAASGAELWLDGGHNPAAGQALAAALARRPRRPIRLICGMLRTKDVRGFLSPLREIADGLAAVSLPEERNMLEVTEMAASAKEVGFSATSAESVQEALRGILAEVPAARVLICGSLYLAGHVLRTHS